MSRPGSEPVATPATVLAKDPRALPVLFVRDLTQGWLGASNALASGLMLCASFGLVYEGVDYGLWRILLGVILGLDFLVLTQRALSYGRDGRWASRRWAPSTPARRCCSSGS